MISNIFTITQQDGLIGAEPDGVFTETSVYPSNRRQLIKGTSDIVCVNAGLPGFYTGKPNTTTFGVKENGILITHPGSSGGTSPFTNPSNPSRLAGHTIYGYLIEFEDLTDVDGRQFPSIILNIITDPNYKTGVATYKGFGRTGLTISRDSSILRSYKIVYRESTDPLTVEFAPLCFAYNPSADNERFINVYIPYLTISGSNFVCAILDLSKHDTIDTQHTDDETYLTKYGPQPVTILDSDVILPSLEDRVDQLEQQVTALPGDIDAAFALAVDKVSKLFITR